ncbi:InlB B-repeat-containing protein [Microterricola viridarii]|uniref:InlB B-repeat-containing protein n=1 Tax=Microterricola viridarii TaxID=412690 RepID=UPI00101ADAC0|nr:InlB B-repeat-containing protein [Microterricola viridarii]
MTTPGYGAGGAGGGGQVTLVGFDSDPAAPVTINAGGPGQPSYVAQGATTTVASAGQNGITDASSSPGRGGASGNGHLGSASGGGGAGAAPDNSYNGGAGQIVSGIAGAGSLFSGDTSCYGGGGASGLPGTPVGVATCGGGSAVEGAGVIDLLAATPNSGGGGAGGGLSTVDSSLRTGASGLVVLRWTIEDVTVSFDRNGYGAGVAPQTFRKGGTAAKPSDPMAAGFVFNGWYTDPTLATPVDFTLPVTASTTFYASWTAIAPVTVTFDTNGRGGSNSTQAVVPGGTATPPVLTEPGYLFDGWFTDAALTTPANFATAITAVTTFYAKWSAVAPATVTVSFNGNGHGAGVAPQTFPKGGTATKPADPTAAGFVFDGWFTDAALTVPADFSAPVSASTTFYAKWSAVAPATVTVSFNGNGHGASVAPVTVAVGGTVAKPADPTAAGFVFDGWFTDAALTVPADFTAPVSASTTFYAKWSAVVKPTPTPTPKPSVAPVPPKTEGPLAKTGAVIDPSAASLALAAIGLGAGLLAVRARRARKTV